MRKLILFLLVILAIIVTACENVDLSKVSDEDLERISENVIACKAPYIRFGATCCLDENSNNLCDDDEAKDTPIESKCMLRAGITCTDFKVTKDFVTVELQNSLGYDISVINAQVGGCGAINDTTTLANRQKSTFTIACTPELDRRVYTAELNITYIVSETGLIHLNKGEITAKVE